jgi:histidinol-phosphate/aromatic aminotransferase/cobyric acid decarboxylase-like protein
VIVHGGPVVAELRALGVDPARLLDLSASCNPYGPCPAVVDAVRAAPLDRYPDPTGRPAREALAAWLDRDPDEIAVGNGAADLLWTLARTFDGPALIVEPAFGELRAAVLARGGRVLEHRAREEDRFQIDLAAIARTAHANRAAVIYLCTPTTPTGATVPAAAVAALAADLPRAHVICDQSFLSLGDRADDARVPMPPNVVLVRSLTKDLGIPGVRIGYLAATMSIVKDVEAGRPAWTTSAAAIAAAIAAPAAQPFVEESRAKLIEDRRALERDLRALGLDPEPSSAPFVIARTGDAAALRQRLLVRHHILVRDCASFGLPAHVRIAARPAPERARLAAALAEVIA